MEALFRQMEPSRARQPSVQVREEEQAWILTLEIPGVDPDAVEVTVQGSRLSLEGRRELMVPEAYKAQRRERGGWSFSESFHLPRTADAERITASGRDGLLIVTVPRLVEPGPRIIPVSN
ncbi:MAG: Hsp20/alpha crystallin family protein [Deltaproteobacteria bacterium]|nr:Hsp20/alpha crystallin family protein [Deltaproteobacteria bacterium]